MPSVKCPNCGEKGPIPRTLVGMRIKCKKCGTPFMVSPPTAKAPPPSVAAAMLGEDSLAARPDTIEVDGLDASAWTVTPVVTAEPDHDHDHEPGPGASQFAASPVEPAEAHDAPRKHYKILTSKDKFFDNKFDLARLEEALNHYAKQGWVVRGMATPHVTGFSGGAREELVVLLER